MTIILLTLNYTGYIHLGINIVQKINMAKVHVCNVLVLDNPAQFMTKLEFEITFECIEDLPEDLEWKIIYVGSAESEEFDQILDTVYVSNINIMHTHFC